MVAHGRVELLAHPLSQKYLQMKWNSYGKYFHVANLMLYCIFLFFVTVFSQQLMYAKERLGLRENSNSSEEVYGSKILEAPESNVTFAPLPPFCKHIQVSMMMYVSGAAILIYVLGNALKEILQVYQQKWHYLFEPANFLSWILYVAAVVMVMPICNGFASSVHYSAASICIFFSWFNLLLLLQRFDQVGIYVVMFLEILQTLLKVLAVFSILIIAFGLAFFILLSKVESSTQGGGSVTGRQGRLLEIPNANHVSFSTIPMSLLRTFSMMLGEMDFVGTYVQPFYLNQLPYPFPAFCILCLFMILMPILLMNLLIGLAVGDIESVRRNAQLKRLAMQVVLHTELERKLPQVWLEKVDKTELIEYPNETKCKLSFMDSLMRKWFCNPFTDDEKCKFTLFSLP